jgi:hypothetical protein
VQVVWSNRRGHRDITHVGSGADEAEVELLRAKGAQLIAGRQGELDLGLGGVSRAALEITSTRMGYLVDALACAYESLGFDRATGGDEVFKALVFARIIEPTSKQDSLRVLEEAGISSLSYRTLNRRLPVWATPGFRACLGEACAAHARLGPAALVLFDVTTLYFEAHEPDEFRIPGFSKERRLEPQITLGLLTDRAGFPLQVGAFEGNTAETATMLPMVRDYARAHQLREVTVVADAGMMSAANLAGIEAVKMASGFGPASALCFGPTLGCVWCPRVRAGGAVWQVSFLPVGGLEGLAWRGVVAGAEVNAGLGHSVIGPCP